MLKLNHLIKFILLNLLFIYSIYATASLKKADYDYNFWFHETQKNTNLTLIDRRIYEFDHFSSRLTLQNQTELYQNLKEQLNHLLEHLKNLCKDNCMINACKGSGNEPEIYVKDWSLFADIKFDQMPFVPKKETVSNVKKQIEWIQDRLQALSYAFCPMITNY